LPRRAAQSSGGVITAGGSKRCYNAAMEAEPSKADLPKRKRRWYQFSLRTLLIGVLIVAIPCALLGRRIERKGREREAIAAIQETAFVEYDYLYNVDHADPPGPAWIRSFLGDDFFAEVSGLYFDHYVGDKVLENLRDLRHLKRLWLVGANITDNGLLNLQAVSELEELNLSYATVTNAGLGHLDGITGLRELTLNNTAVGDGGLIHLKGMTDLRTLLLSNTAVCDVGLASLKRLSRLECLDLSYTRVTDAGVNSLQAALPNCKINATH
jgi:hypothetical protein